MSWTSYLPDDPDRLSALEWWLWVGLAILAIIGAMLGYVAREVGRHRAEVERAGLHRELASTKGELDQKNRELERLAKQVEQDGGEVKGKHAPRRLTPSQGRQLVELLTGKPGSPVTILALLGDHEAIQYANELMAALRTAGWAVDGVKQGAYTLTPVGVHVSVRERKAPPAGAELLLQSLRSLGLQVTFTQKSGISPDTIELVVGRRPE